MTAEICIMNKNAIALAADSTVTIGDGIKFINTVNKIFMLSFQDPVGIMMYQNGEFMGVPWEILIKEFRNEYCKTSKNNLFEYGKSFIDFLQSRHYLFSNNEEKLLKSNLIELLDSIDYNYNEFTKLLAQELSNPPSPEEAKELFKTTVLRVEKIYESYKDLGLENKDEIISYIKKAYEKSLKSEITEKFKELLDENLTEQIYNLYLLINFKNNNLFNYTGIVITGYGKEDIFPSLISYKIYAIYNSNLLFLKEEERIIDNQKQQHIIPFAQKETVEQFLYGISNNFLNDIELFLNEELKDELKDKYTEKSNNIMDKIVNECRKKYYSPLVPSIVFSTVEELAKMAETLVNMTLFRRQVAIDEYSQTVGGPIDVAVISKFDGFIWIKRKHYFKPDLNVHYFSKIIGNNINKQPIECGEEINEDE